MPYKGKKLLKINWEEFKEYKQYNSKNDNFEMLLDFIKSYYNISSPTDIYNILREDEIAQMMLEKRNIKDAESLEKFLFKIRQ
jgi:hypothetical protein